MFSGLHGIDFQDELTKRDPFQWSHQLPASSVADIANDNVQMKQSQTSMQWKLAGISFSSDPCALVINDDEQTQVVRTGDEIGHGWKVDKIHEKYIVCKNSHGEGKELRL